MRISNFKLRLICHFLFLSLILLYSAESHCSAKINNIVIDLSNYIPLIDAEIENKKVRLLFDTGATTTLILNEKILNNIKQIKKSGAIRKSIDSTGNISVASEFIIPKISINSSIFYNINTYPYRPWGLQFADDSNNQSHNNEGYVSQGFHKDQDGVIGLAFFSNKKILIDYSNKKVIAFTENELPKPYQNKKWYPINAETGPEGLIISANLNDSSARFLLDTGATASILHSNLIKNNSSSIIANLLCEKFQIENHLFHAVDFNEPKVDGILGYDFFKKTIVLIDNLNKTVYFSHS